ncbi:MAG TPA: hypothetical protein VIH03_02540, partial [Nitrososphaerales archaeon]
SWPTHLEMWGGTRHFFDVTSAKVALFGGNLSFSVTVADQIPQSPQASLHLAGLLRLGSHPSISQLLS